jgi:hypothetical protein
MISHNTWNSICIAIIALCLLVAVIWGWNAI